MRLKMDQILTTTEATDFVNSSHLGSNSSMPMVCTTTDSSTCPDSDTSFGDGANGDSYFKHCKVHVELSAFLLIAVVGAIGNVFVLGVVIFCKDMRTVANYFIVSLSVADLLVSLMVMPIVAVTRWRREWLLGESFCDFQAILNHMCMFASLFSLAAVAVNRVVITRRPGRYHALFSKPLSLLYISITWFLSLLYALLPAFGWGEFEYDEKRYNCIFSRQAAPSYSLFFALCCILLPQLICAACYITILVTFVQSRAALEHIPEVTVIGNTSASEAKLTKNLFVVWITFFLCWLPMNTMLLIDPKGELDESIYTVAVWVMLANSCVNPIIYGVQNKHFREGYVKVLKKTSLAKRFHRARVGPAALGNASSRLMRESSRSPQTSLTGSSRPHQGHTTVASVISQRQSHIC